MPVVQAGWTTSTSDAPVAIHKVKVGNDLDAAMKETTADAPLETALTVGEENNSDSGAGRSDSPLLRRQWLVRSSSQTDVGVKVVSLLSANPSHRAAVSGVNLASLQLVESGLQAPSALSDSLPSPISSLKVPLPARRHLPSHTRAFFAPCKLNSRLPPPPITTNHCSARDRSIEHGTGANEVEAEVHMGTLAIELSYDMYTFSI